MMTRAELTNEIARSIQTTQREARDVLDAVLDSLVKALRAGDKIELRRFGTFSIQFRKARIGFIPHRGARTAVRAKRVARFHPSKEMLSLVNGSLEEESCREPE